MPHSTSWDHEAGLAALEGRLTDPAARQALEPLAKALRKNLHDAKIYGPNPANREERTQLIQELNRLALQHTGGSFNDLCSVKREDVKT